MKLKMEWNGGLLSHPLNSGGGDSGSGGLECPGVAEGAGDSGLSPAIGLRSDPGAQRGVSKV